MYKGEDVEAAGILAESGWQASSWRRIGETDSGGGREGCRGILFS